LCRQILNMTIQLGLNTMNINSRLVGSV
jgi:hypothetical protein